MDILELLKAKRETAAKQVNALDTAIRALSGMNSTRVSHGPRKMSAAARARISASQRARWHDRGPEGYLNRSQASHLGSRSSEYQKGNQGEMGKVESRTEIAAGIQPRTGHSLSKPSVRISHQTSDPGLIFRHVQ
jgi:hypothetical protein